MAFLTGPSFHFPFYKTLYFLFRQRKKKKREREKERKKNVGISRLGAVPAPLSR